MKVLVIGNGGREHALCWRLSQSPTVRELFCARGNPGIDKIAKPVALAPNDTSALANFADQNKIDLTVVGPEDVLALGIVDEFERRGMRIFGPGKAAAQLEASKVLAKSVMNEAHVPTANFESFTDPSAARRHIENRRCPMVIKADGLALGKGVFVCHDTESALAAAADTIEHGRFGAAGARIIVEDFLSGEEVSFFALSDGRDAVSLGFVQDHKRIFDGDRGPNTGGMGAYSPLPHFGPALEKRVMSDIVQPILDTMASRGTPFRGVLYAGLMIDGDRLNALEFNVRFGDPECQALMMRFESDLAEALLAAAESRIGNADIRLSPKYAAAVILASGGYPGEYRTGIRIEGLERIEGGKPSEAKVRWAMKKARVKVFHAGTAWQGDNLVTAGGRVLTVTAMASDLPSAVATAYEASEMIRFEGRHMRTDIARHGLAHLTAGTP
ncbi:MAG: phosphoribosylamine--glycine ligase [Candidatus Binataceae bacterium]